MFKELLPFEQKLLSETLFSNGISMPKMFVNSDKRIGILVKRHDNQPIDESDTAYLHKVFATPDLKLKRTDYVIIDVVKMSAKDITKLIDESNLKTIFCFNIIPPTINVNTTIPYVPFIQHNVTYVFAHSLDIFRENKEFKRSMLTTLQSFFANG